MGFDGLQCITRQRAQLIILKRAMGFHLSSLNSSQITLLKLMEVRLQDECCRAHGFQDGVTIARTTYANLSSLGIAAYPDPDCGGDERGMVRRLVIVCHRHRTLFLM